MEETTEGAPTVSASKAAHSEEVWNFENEWRFVLHRRIFGGTCGYCQTRNVLDRLRIPRMDCGGEWAIEKKR